MNKLGADILRLWIASADYSNEMSLSQEILKRNADAYRRLRNTRAPARQPGRLRPAQHLRPLGQMVAGPLDRASRVGAAGEDQRPTTAITWPRSCSCC